MFERYAKRAAAEPRLQCPDGLSIRAAADPDAAVITEISAERHNVDSTDKRLESTRVMLRAAAQGQSAYCLVATLDDDVIGFANCSNFRPPSDAPPNTAPAGWYLSGVVVRPQFRRRGIGAALTTGRLDWLAQHAACVYYVASVQNRVSIELHEALGFVEVTRDFHMPGVSFTGGVGALHRCTLEGLRERHRDSLS